MVSIHTDSNWYLMNESSKAAHFIDVDVKSESVWFGIDTHVHPDGSVETSVNNAQVDV